MKSSDQQIRFCKSSDGVSLAYATVGDGPPLVKAANWLNHLEHDWNSAVWRHWITELSRDHTLIRYDERGCGLSDWKVEEFSLDAWVRDLEAVVDSANVDRFPLLGISQGGPIAVAYAARHPERVSQMILYGSYAAGLKKRHLSEKSLDEAEVLLQLIKVGWGKEHAAFRQVFTSLFIPEATAEQANWFNELQRVSSTPENAVRMLNAFHELDVRELASELRVPTLVLHATGDLRIPFVEGRQLAALIPGARFVPLESKNHILLRTEPAWHRFLSEVRAFLGVTPTEHHATLLWDQAKNTRASPFATETRWKEISALFERAVSLGKKEREDLLAAADPELRLQVEALLAQDASASLAPDLGEIVKSSMLSLDQSFDDLSGRSISHYRVLEKIGEGGMGTIYKARDERLDRFVALKFLPPYLSSRQELKNRFVREARAAAALDHPNICTVYEIGETGDGQLFISMPCYEGETIRNKIDRGPLDIYEALDYAVQAAEGLAEAHANGIIHRDIKPANLFVANRGELKILDFGVAKFADIDLTGAGIVVGTVAYMSPEQASGKSLDYRTDMWSFGVVLHEMLSGRHPFAGEPGNVSLYAIQHEKPVPITLLRPAVPAALDTILARLLAKERSQRYLAFAEVADDLRAVQQSTDFRLRAKDVTAAVVRTVLPSESANEATSVDSFASGSQARVIVGREAELRQLEGLLEKAHLGAGRIVFITGEPGLGKTSLANEFLDYANQRPGSILCSTGYCVEQYGTSEAYLPFLNALAKCLGGPAKELVAPILLSHAPAWSLQFTSTFAGSEVREQLRRETIGATQERMLREMGDCLAALTAQLPMVMLLEDIHWADPPSVKLIRYLGHLIGRMRLVLIGTLRPEQLTEINRPLRDCLGELKAHDQCDEIALSTLGRQAIIEHLDAQFTPNDFSPELATLIEQKTGGHPLFTTRLARDLVERGAIVRRNSGWSLAQEISRISLEMPESVLALIRRRIQLLDETDQRLLQFASIQGEEFLSQVLFELTSLDRVEVEERLDRLSRSSHLLRHGGEEELPDGSMATRYRFAHALYQNVLYGDLVGERRRRLHRQTGELLELHYADKSGWIASQLGMHFERSRDFARAVPYLVQVGDNSGRVHATADAVDHYSHALELVARLPVDDRAHIAPFLYLKRGTMNLACSRFDAAIADFEEAIRLSRATGVSQTEHAALNGLILTYFISHKMDEMATCVAEALSLSERSRHHSLRLETLAYMAQQQTCYGELDEAIKLNLQIISEATDSEDQAALTMALIQRGELHLHQTEYAQAEELLEHGVDQALELGHHFQHMYGLFMLGMAQGNRGKISAALATFNRLKKIAERNGDRAWLVRCPNSIGWIYREMQDLERAISHDREGADLTEGSEFQEVLAHSLINLSYDYAEQHNSQESFPILKQAEAARDHDVWMRWRHNIRLQAALAEHWLAARDLGKAETYGQELLRVATRYQSRKYIAAAHRLLGEVAAARNLFVEAETQFQTAVALLQQYPAPLLAWKTYAAWGRIRLENGDPGLAGKAFDEARLIITQLAANTDEEDLRQTFLNSVPVREVFENSTSQLRPARDSC